MSVKSEKQERIREATKWLKKLLKPGDTVYTSLLHVSSSGMTRRIQCFVMKVNQPVCISGSVALLTGSKHHDQGGVVVGGCGMDMGFSLVYSLSRSLFPKGFKVGRKGTRARNGDSTGYDTDGGYALNQRWM